MNSTTTNSTSAEAIEYRLSFPNFRSHIVDIEVSLPTLGRESVVLMMPAWTPGSYLIREYARHVETIAAFDVMEDHSLEIKKISKNQWQVKSNGSERILLRYQLYCREQSVRTNWIEKDYGFLTGAATFITLDDDLPRPHVVRIRPLDSWPLIACSLPTIPSAPINASDMDAETTSDSNNANDTDDDSTIVHPIALSFDRYATSYDELVDSPILMGDLSVRRFEVHGFPHFLACYGTTGTWDTDRAVRDIRRIVDQEHRFWGEVPYKEYWFLNIEVDAYGGLEHDDCTVLMARRNTMKQRESYLEWLGLVSHEFFHTWNVRRLRPQSLMKYNYHAEQYLAELWIAEGITSYYDDLLLIREGLSTEKEYLEQLGKMIRVVEEAPGHLVQSLYDSSYDAWIKHYRPDENASNSRISYYTKGAVVAFLLDQLIRDKTGDQKSLDDVMRMLWTTCKSTGYVLKDFEEIAKKVVGPSMAGEALDDWFQKHVYEAVELDYTHALDRLGLTFNPSSHSFTSDVTMTAGFIVSTGQHVSNDPSQVSSELERPQIDLGLDLTLRDGRWIVTKILRLGAAWQAGLQVDDEMIAIGGYRLPKENWRDRIQEFPPLKIVECSFVRRGRMMSCSLKCLEKHSLVFQSVLQASPLQLENRRRWLGSESSMANANQNIATHISTTPQDPT